MLRLNCQGLHIGGLLPGVHLRVGEGELDLLQFLLQLLGRLLRLHLDGLLRVGHALSKDYNIKSPFLICAIIRYAILLTNPTAAHTQASLLDRHTRSCCMEIRRITPPLNETTIFKQKSTVSPCLPSVMAYPSIIRQVPWLLPTEKFPRGLPFS